MINVTRINGQALLVNPDLMQTVEHHGDTVIALTSGDKILVKESLEELADKVLRYRIAIHQQRQTALEGEPRPRRAA